MMRPKIYRIINDTDSPHALWWMVSGDLIWKDITEWLNAHRITMKNFQVFLNILSNQFWIISATSRKYIHRDTEKLVPLCLVPSFRQTIINVDKFSPAKWTVFLKRNVHTHNAAKSQFHARDFNAIKSVSSKHAWKHLLLIKCDKLQNYWMICVCARPKHIMQEIL